MKAEFLGGLKCYKVAKEGTTDQRKLSWKTSHVQTLGYPDNKVAEARVAESRVAETRAAQSSVAQSKSM